LALVEVAVACAGSFRADLLYRFKVFPIEVPFLSIRTSNIPLLVNRFVGKFPSMIDKKINGGRPRWKLVSILRQRELGIRGQWPYAPTYREH